MLAWTLVAALGCSTPERGDWVREVLIRADAQFWSRPALLADKYRRMAADPYDFYRGSAPLFFADAARPGDRPTTVFLDDPDAQAVLLFGDPHPENLGTNLPEGGTGDPGSLEIEVVDLDAVGFGPWTLDLRRAALGLSLLRPGAPGLSAALAAGYAEAILGDPVDTSSMVIADLRALAAEEGADGARLDEVTSDGALWLDTALDEQGRGVLPLDAEDAARFERLSDCLPSQARVRDVARLYGKGVASMPAIRFLVLYDLGDGPDDLLEIREIVDPSPIPGLWTPPGLLFESGADRVVSAGDRLWGNLAADPRRATCVDGAQSFKTLSGGSYFQGPEHVTLRDDPSDEDLQALAADLGRVIGRGHRPSADVIGPALDGRLDLLIAELDPTAARDRLLADYQDFATLVAQDPLLGIADLRREVP